MDHSPMASSSPRTGGADSAASATRSAAPERLDPQRLRSAAWVRFFNVVMRRHLQRSFHAVRLARPGLPPLPAGPLVIYFNHPSWWDAALVPVLAAHYFPERAWYAPIDAEALQRYGFMRRLGFFGIKADSYAGSAAFLRIGASVLSRPGTMFCLTPEGSFTDPRQRPVTLRPGLAALVARVPHATLLPMAIEYPFWSERTPEALVRFGEPIVFEAGQALPAPQIQQTLTQGLTATMDALAADAASRDPARFEAVFEGRAGVGGVYDLWRRWKAWRAGERFDPAHAPLPGQDSD